MDLQGEQRRDVLRVVVCDDRHDQSLLMKTWLEMAPDIEVIGCPYTRAMAVMQCQEFEPDVLVMDYMMPGEDIQVTSLRDLLPNTPILLWTGYDRHHLPAEVIVAVNGVLVKVLDKDVAIAAVRNVAAQRTPPHYD